MRLHLISILLAGASCLSAQITWQATESTQKADLFAKNVLYTFQGKNNSSETIKIESLRTSCPCLEVSSDKTELAPGEEILVVGDFDTYEIGGKQRQRILIVAEGQEKPDVLTVVAELPETITLSHKRLYWKSSGEAESRLVTMHLSADANIELIDVYAMDENFSTELKEISSNHYTLSVTPEDLSVQRPAAVMIRYKANDRPVRATITCLIGDKNPFEFSYKPKLKRISGSEIEASIRNQAPLYIPKGLSNLEPAQPLSSETEPKL